MIGVRDSDRPGDRDLGIVVEKDGAATQEIVDVRAAGLEHMPVGDELVRCRNELRPISGRISGQDRSGFAGECHGTMVP
jgi:hypothetical protein